MFFRMSIPVIRLLAAGAVTETACSPSSGASLSSSSVAAVSVSAADDAIAAATLATRTPAALTEALAAVLVAMRGDRNVLLAGIAASELVSANAGPATEEAPRAAS